MIESETVEFKREYTDKIWRTIVAFANGNGGSLYVGIDDSGRVAGVDDVDDVQLRIKTLLRDSIRPDVTMFSRIVPEKMDEKWIVRVDVGRGTSRPYYSAEKGLRREGVYVRVGASNELVSEQGIRDMIVASMGLTYEREPSLVNELTFEEAAQTFARLKVGFGPEHFGQLGLVDTTGRFTNLALLLSDQNPHTLKVAVFESSDETSFRDRIEFSGSVLSQLESCYKFIDKYNRKRAGYRGLERVERPDYEPICLREALVNAIVHCDYSQSGSTRVEIYDNRMVFVNFGGLVEGLSISDLNVGASKCRNERLASVFYRLRLVESYGTGMRKILGQYPGMRVQDLVEVGDHLFRLTLPGRTQRGCGMQRGRKSSAQMRYEEILRLFEHRETITRGDVEEATGCSLGTAIRDIAQLLKQKRIEKVGAGRMTIYKKRKEKST